MVRKYYNDFETDRSVAVLDKLTSSADFVLIGGWAVHNYVKLQKSKDVDLVIPLESLGYFKGIGMQKHEISAFYSMIDGIVVDVFVQGYSDKELTIPISDILGNYNRVRNIKVVDKNMLLLLKLCGYFSWDRAKIEKDVIDVVSLLFYGEIDLKKVREYINRYKIEDRNVRMGILEYLDKGANLWEYLTESKEEYVRLRNRYREEIKKTIY
jgi:hypothetical protein